ncbi:hypothetical protein Bbelb_354590 [Branchiostoma belcheri]|nr:hypothetical protein Bbelb_354590 [Branchiostoma belcheri]
MMQGEVRRQEEENRRAQAVSQVVQGAWTKWEQARERKVTWKDLWLWEPVRTQFLLKSMYDLLPTRQGRFRWRHDRILRALAIVLEGEKNKEKGEEEERAEIPNDWVMRVDLERKLKFPEVVLDTNLRPDIVPWSEETKQVVMKELTVPWEDRLEEAHERKAEKYRDLRQSCAEKGWKAWCYPVEVGCRGFVSQTVWRALGALGMRGKNRKDAVKNLGEAAEAASRWVWLRCKDNNWYNHNE